MDELLVQAFLEYLTEKGDVEGIAKLYEKHSELIERDTIEESEEQVEAGWEKLQKILEICKK